MASIDQFAGQAKSFISGLQPKQRWLLLGSAALTVVVLSVFARMISTPEYKVLMTGMEPSDAQSLGGRLAAKNIPYQISPDGKSVSVANDKLDSSRMEVATEGMPRSGRLGFELFDKLNWGQTEFDEKVNYQRALEGELERTIQTLRDVQSARVHLVMPNESVFLDRERPAKASVILRLRSGQLSDDTHRAISTLVSGAVDKLSRDNVAVIDADTNRPLTPHRRNSDGSDAGLEEELSSRLIATLEPVVGVQQVRASVNVEYDPSTSEENQETYDPKSAVAVTTQRSEEQINGGTLGGVPGTTSNVPSAGGGAKQADVEGDSTQVSKSESNTYAVDKMVRHTMQPAGRIRRLTAALVVDDAVEIKQENGKSTETRRKRTSEEMKQIQQLAEAAIGLDAKRGDTLAVENLSFQQPSPKSTELPASRVEKFRVILNDWSSLVRYGALILLFLLAYLLLLRPLKKQAVTALKQIPERAISKQQAELAARDLQNIPAELRSMTDEQRRTFSLQKQMVEKVKTEPLVTSKLVQSWLHESGQ